MPWHRIVTSVIAKTHSHSQSDAMSKIVRKVSIRNLIRADVEAVVAIHMRAFPTFFLTVLGARFLREFYTSFLLDPVGRGFVAVDHDGQVLGAVVGPLQPSGYFRRLVRRRWWAFALSSFAAVIKKPGNVGRLLGAAFYRGESPSGPVRALLSSIAVDPAAQGRGVGRLLVERWVKEVRAMGVSGCYLTTDAEKNDRVNAFYCELGWWLESTYQTREGRQMNRYLLDF